MHTVTVVGLAAATALSSCAWFTVAYARPTHTHTHTDCDAKISAFDALTHLNLTTQNLHKIIKMKETHRDVNDGILLLSIYIYWGLGGLSGLVHNQCDPATEQQRTKWKEKKKSKRKRLEAGPFIVMNAGQNETHTHTQTCHHQMDPNTSLGLPRECQRAMTRIFAVLKQRHLHITFGPSRATRTVHTLPLYILLKAHAELTAPSMSNADAFTCCYTHSIGIILFKV